MFLLFLDVLELELQVTHTFILVGLEPKSSPKIIQSRPETVDFVHFKHRFDSTLDQNVTTEELIAHLTGTLPQKK